MTIDISDLCPVAQLAARRFVDRLRFGQSANGKWDLTAPKDWRKERQEELLDALVYDIVEDIQEAGL